MHITPKHLFICAALSLLTTLILTSQQRLIGTFATSHTRGTRAVFRSEQELSNVPPEEHSPVSSNTFWLEKNETRPPLEALVGDNETDVKADVQFLLDFAIIGHAKTATTYKLGWLLSNDEIQGYNYELHALQRGYPAKLVQLMYDLPAGYKYKRGYKAPQDITNWKVMQAFYDYFPETKLIVGLRHPVSWFQSYYNFRVRQGYDMPPAENLTECIQGAVGVCPDEGRFHLHLSYLGKTNRTSSDEQELLGEGDPRMQDIPPLKNPVFLYETTQLRDENLTRSALYRADLKDYLSLEQDLKPLKSEHTRREKENVLDICEEKYDHVRGALMEHARAASVWIREYFLPHPDVRVSSPEYFTELLELWLEDPCEQTSDE